LDCLAASIGHAISGLPHRSFMFLPGSPLLPDLAGIMQQID